MGKSSSTGIYFFFWRPYQGKRLTASVLLCFSLIMPLEGQINYDKVRAEEEFRYGVNAFHAGLYKKAILSFEAALTLDNEDDQYHRWLGRSYLQNGIVESFFEQWGELISNSRATQAMINYYDFIDFHYRKESTMLPRAPYINFYSIQGERGKTISSLLGPTAVTAQDEFLYVVDFSGNRVQKITPNGNIAETYKGSLQTAFNHPFDILPLDNGNIVISEAQADRLLLCDATLSPIRVIGERGSASGQMVAPQYLADSGDGYFYVSDWGNRRISKWDYDGNFIFSFSGSDSFEGFRAPTGIVVIGELLYVADMLLQAILIFNQNGDFVGTLPTGSLISPEGLTVDADGRLLIADNDTIKAYNFSLRTLEVIHQGENTIYQDVCQNLNGELVTASFRSNRVDVMTREDQLYNDLFVNIFRVHSDAFPQVRIDLQVLNHDGMPVNGLRESNFQVVEGSRQLDSAVIYQGHRDNSTALSIIPDSNSDAVVRIINSLYSQRTGGDFYRLITGDTLLEAHNINGGDPNIVTALLGRLNLRGRDDTTMHLAIDTIVSRQQTKSLIMISDGGVSDPFDDYNIADTAAYMKNNGIRLHVIYTDGMARRDDLEYLARETGGKSINSLEPGAIESLVELIRATAVGTYSIQYASPEVQSVDQIYLPVGVQVRYIRKSGRDELGYLTPMLR